MKIALLGDIALFGNVSILNNPNTKKYYSDIAQHLKTYDYVVGNLETPFSKAKQTNGAKSAYICSDVENIEILKALNINAVTLANNHIFDYGKEGYELTKKLLDESGIKYFGTEGEQLLVDIENNKLAFSGFCCYSTNPLNVVEYGKYGVNAFNVPKVKELISSNHKKGYLNILSVHAGIEHVNYPSVDTIMLARQFSEICPYVYYGHHPHVSQGIENVNNSILAYSLGNFCFDDVYTSISTEPLVKMSDNNRSSFILELEIISNDIVNYSTTPIYIAEDKIIVGKGTSANQINEFTNKICSTSVEDYTAMRHEYINQRYNSRKKQRTIGWFLQRLRPRYIRLLVDLYINKRKYKKNVKIHIR